MPLCRLVAAASPWIAAHGQRLRRLHAGPSRMHLEGKNHYERLNLDPGASAGDVKRSFYLLSKRHHPDANPSDPQAASTFSLLSESYSVLSNPSRRALYDRDILRLSHARPNPAASYHSTNPAGGRSPSGLSRRKTSFRGPPPSFFRSGGWGAHAEKRRQAHDESAGAHQRPADHRDEHGYDDVPHFDREGHTRTHRREDDRRASRMMRRRRMARAVGDDDVEFEPQTSLTAHFLIVAAILAATFLAPAVYLQLMRLGKTGDDDGHHKKK